VKLLSSPTSPFARKIQVLARELGLALEDHTVATLPTKVDPSLTAVNPLSKIPALILDDGGSLYDSRVIAEYMCSLVPEQTLLPTATVARARFDVLRRQALADGVTDAAVLIRYETFLRPKNLLWQEWIGAQEAKIAAGLDALEQTHAGIAARPSDARANPDLGSIATVCALDYLMFRSIGPAPLSAARPHLRALHAALSGRESFRVTLPK
jgi:glutathione S-transferase